MLYDYQYTFIAVLVSLTLAILTWQRGGYRSGSCKTFYLMLFSNFIAAGLDIFTYFTISYPGNFPVWVLYWSNIVYLWFYGLVGISFTKYFIVLLQDEKLNRICDIACVAALAVEGVLLATTQLTGWMIRFDTDLVYRHGPLFSIIYPVPLIFTFISILLLLRGSDRFGRYQKITTATVFLITMFFAAYQIVNPRADMFHLVCAMIDLVIYIVFENPAYYAYHSTRCFNERAFYSELVKQGQKNGDTGLTVVGILNRPLDYSIRASQTNTKLLDRTADLLRERFKTNVFCLANGRFVIMRNENGTHHINVREALEKLFERPVNIDGEELKISFSARSFNLSEATVCDDYIDHLLECFQQEPMNRLLSENIPELILKQHHYREVEDALMRGIRNDGFYMTYQPIYDIGEKEFHSAEALVRLKDPTLGYLRPDMFIPVAEHDGMIVQMGEMILEKVCRFLTECPETIRYIEVNVSPVQLKDPDMAKRFIAILEKFGISPDRINLEITESAINLTEEAVRDNLFRLNSYGISFSIDDYGSGYASTGHLLNMPISIVKIDRSILLKAVSSDDGMIVFRDSIATVKKLCKHVVVEGAENEEMVDMIKNAGGDFIQGYYYSKPLEKDDFVSFLKKGEDVN